MLSEFGISPSKEMTERYSVINKGQWELLEKKQKTRDEVLIDRFTIFFSEIGADIDSMKAREIYEYRLGCGHYFIDGAEALLESLGDENIFEVFFNTRGCNSSFLNAFRSV